MWQEYNLHLLAGNEYAENSPEETYSRKYVFYVLLNNVIVESAEI